VSLVNNQNKLSHLLLSTIEDPDEERIYLGGREIYQNLYSIEESIKSSLETSSNEVQTHLFKINRLYKLYKNSVENALEISTVDTKLALKELIKSGDASQELNNLFIKLSDFHTKSLNISDELLNNSLLDQTKINAISFTLILIMIILPILFFRKLTGNLDQINKALVKLNNGETQIVLPDTNDTYIKNLADVVIAFQETLFDIVEAKKKAEESSTAKSEFLAVMSHEIRTPMNGVLGMLNRIIKSDLTNEQLHIIKTAQTSAQSLLRIINDILDFSKIDAGKLDIDPMDFDLAQLITSIMSEQKLASKNTQLALTSNINFPHGSHFHGDPIRTKQILDNLLSNAIKFTENGSVTLTASSIDVGPNQNNIIFTIKDTGCGIPQNKLDVLFEPFTQADSSTTRQYGGTGLGLSIVRKLCHLMDGYINVSSTVNSGSEFVVSLPLMPIESAQDNNTADTNLSNLNKSGEQNVPELQDGKQINNQNKKVLIVEDNAINIEVLTYILEDLYLNLDISTATDGSLAIKKLNACSILTPFDLVLMDCQMPVMDGYEASKQIRSGKAGNIYVNAPIIAITANAMKGDKEKCLLAGMTDFLSKPINEDELKTILEKHL
jgi:signal transduction histidine kinase/CheY-like chemotaxis protein